MNTESSRSRLKQRMAFLAPIAVIGTMFPIFRLLDQAVGRLMDGYLGWYLGLWVYWVVWGMAYSGGILGLPEIRKLLRPRRLTPRLAGLALFPAAAALIVRLMVPGMGYGKQTLGVSILLASTTVGNGICEEVLWRGTYLRLFAQQRSVRVVWASVMFGIWHYVPVSLHSTGTALVGMIVGSAMFGFYLAYLARRTDSLWWPVVAHVGGGLVMVL